MKIKSIHNLKGRITSLIILLGIIFIAQLVKADQWGDWTYTSDGSNVTITGYGGTDGDVVIPDEIFNMPVRNIGNNAFFNNYSLKSIYIGTNVISIGDNAFWVCTNLASINAPSSLTNIGFQAFYYCFGMTNFQLGMATPHIGKWAFVFCWNLPSIGVDSNNSAYVSRDGVLFNKDMTQLIACPGGVSGSYVIPSSVTQIAYSAFSSCGRITEVIIPNSVTHIGESAFGGCASITNFISLKNVTSLSTGAFFNCKKISGFRLGKGLSMIESEVFFMCEAITNMVIPASVTNIQSGTFQYCAALTDINFLADEPMGEPLSLGCYNATVYYYPWTSGWTDTFGGRPTQVNPAYTQWLLDYSFATNRTEDSTDYDNDGMKNWQEFIAHTDPTTNIDLLAIISMGSESNSSQISWSAKSNVSYQVMKSSDLMVAWSNAPSGIGGNQQSYQTAPVDGLLQYADPNVADMTNAFYRVNVVP
jgi:hypothetical protein